VSSLWFFHVPHVIGLVRVHTDADVVGVDKVCGCDVVVDEGVR